MVNIFFDVMATIYKYRKKIIISKPAQFNLFQITIQCFLLIQEQNVETFTCTPYPCRAEIVLKEIGDRMTQ